MKSKAKHTKEKYGIAICLAVCVLLLCVAGSYAAYTNFSSAKRVVSAQADEHILFSSNMLYTENKDTESSFYQRKRIALTENNDFVVEIYNYDPGDTAVYCHQNIIYQLKVTLLSGFGSPEEYKVSDGTTEHFFSIDSNGAYTLVIDQLTLYGEQLSTHSFRFHIPEQDKNQMKMCVEAIPMEESYGATNQKKLAAVILTGEMITSKTWSGQLVDVQSEREPDDYDGFNYEISGNGEGTVTLEWDPDILTINPWFVSQTGAVSVSDGAIKFAVGGDGQPFAYQTQFYKADKWDTSISWENLVEKIKVIFSE